MAEEGAVRVVPAQAGTLHLGGHADLYVDHRVEAAAVAAWGNKNLSLTNV